MDRNGFPNSLISGSRYVLEREASTYGSVSSEDLRIRVIRAVEGGMSRNAAARHFGVSIASAVRWMDDYLRTGRTGPRPRGGDRRSGRIEAQRDFLMAAIAKEPDIILAELRDCLRDERGERFALSTIHEFFRRHDISFNPSYG